MDRLYRIEHHGRSGSAVERDGALREVSGDPFGSYTAGAEIAGGLKAAGLKLLPPVTPSKIVCVGLNYKDHAAETGKPLPAEPLLFIKPSTAVIGPGRPILMPPGVGRVDYEAELGLVISRRAHRVPRARAWDFIRGLVCVNDVTARDLQKTESQFTRCKGFDTFAPIGPCVAVTSPDTGGSPRMVESYLNGERRQSSSTAELIFPIDMLVEFITFVMTLEPGDIIATGTPAGIAGMNAGDTITIRVEGVGDLTNPVEAER
jgi:2-keto-4-pentenoate hydratase/2-oxohepta-3-ene-1,7-dioic acid hydratase in catechol pathway